MDGKKRKGYFLILKRAHFRKSNLSLFTLTRFKKKKLGETMRASPLILKN